MVADVCVSLAVFRVGLSVFRILLIFFGSGDTEPVPVVSLTEEHDTALEDKGFKRMLKKIGLKPPDNQQVS